MVVSNNCIADEVFECSSLQVIWHDFAFCVRLKPRRIANLATKFNTGYRGLQIVGVRQVIAFDLYRVVSSGSRQTDAALAFCSYNASEQCPGIRRWIKSGSGFGATERKFPLASLQIRSFESGIALPEIGSFGPVVTGSKRLLRLPDTTDTEMVLKVLCHAGKVLHDGDSEASQLGPVADSRQHQHLWCMHRAERQHNLTPCAETMDLSFVGNLDSRRSLTMESHACNQCVGEHGQVRPIHQRK